MRNEGQRGQGIKGLCHLSLVLCHFQEIADFVETLRSRVSIGLAIDFGLAAESSAGGESFTELFALAPLPLPLDP
ncbi:MAG: hypothetical protein DMG09_06040 [Acidobacteria bacterium]|nr:MAG: hypothetical protein DMG09_06040 [Acidobacteriota bacterium]